MYSNRIKPEALAYRTKTPIRYFKDEKGNPLEPKPDIAIGTFYKALRHELIRYETAEKVLEILGVPPERRREFIEEVAVAPKTEVAHVSQPAA